MMKSRPYLKNSVRTGLNLLVIICLISGCTSSTAPTYLKEDIQDALQNICKNEYKIDLKATLVGSTLWIYLPVEGMFEKSDKPEKYSEKFAIDNDEAKFNEGVLKVEYMVRDVPENEKLQEYKYNKDAMDKIGNVWKSLRRVVFSMGHSKDNLPKFFCLVTADIKNGFEMREVSYYLDLKKVSYELISWSEYQHRVISSTGISPAIIGDKEGRHLIYSDISMEEFLASQIQQRIKLKFQKPEVDKNSDIDKEILKIAVYTLKTYGFTDFSSVELNNLLTKNKTVLNQAALLAKPME
jgi:hypothetical protein